jgi:hypothetical protein
MRFDPMKLPKAAEWRASFGGSPGLLDFLGEQGGATMAVAFAGLFWPSFVEVRGCVVLEERHDERTFEEWWRKLEGDCAAIEEVINHFHLWDVFEFEDEDVPEEGLTYVGEVLVRTWRCALSEQFPEREFRVQLFNDVNDYGPTITLSSVVR